LGRTRREKKKKSVWKQQLFSFILVFISNLYFWDWKISNLIIRSDAHRIDVTSVLLSWKDDHEVAWQKSSSSFLMCFLHIVLEDYGGIMSQRIVFVCRLSRIILQDFGVHFVLWWIVQVLKDFVLHFQVCSKFVVLRILKFLRSFAFLSVL
jgi:hypothetical protein